jgi:hypothetical protein
MFELVGDADITMAAVADADGTGPAMSTLIYQVPMCARVVVSGQHGSREFAESPGRTEWNATPKACAGPGGADLANLVTVNPSDQPTFWGSISWINIGGRE